jgi:hypothetical protein
MGFTVSRSFRPLETNDSIFDTHILVSPTIFSNTDFNNAMDWVFHGGRLVYLGTEDSFINSLERINERISSITDSDGVTSQGYTLYRHGLGEVITGDATPLLNAALMEDSSSGAVFVGLLRQWGTTNINFNESVHGFLESGNAWFHTPEVMRVLVYQLFIIAALIIWHYGKRFGKPIPYFEEVEREENEHLKALANIYNKADSVEVVLSNYRKNFLENCSKTFRVNLPYARDNLQRLWSEASLPHLDLIAEIPEENASVPANKLKYYVKIIQTCENSLNAKGEEYAGRLHTDGGKPNKK